MSASRNVVIRIAILALGLLGLTGSGLVAASGSSSGGAKVAVRPAAQATTTPGPGRTFPETGMTVQGEFLQYWEANGGLAQQGYPISGEFREISDLDGFTYAVQYFERAVFELHMENDPPFNVLLSQLGTFKYKERYADAGAPNQTASTTNPRLFPETGMTLGGRFREYWEANGGLAQQGYPISNEFQEVSELDGKTYTVQYFERAVFELHSENQPPFDVLLSQLGTFQFKSKYPEGVPAVGAIPIVSLQATCLLGGTNGKRWVQPLEFVTGIKGGEQYYLYELTKALGTAPGAEPFAYDGPCPESSFIEIEKPAGAEAAVIGLAGDWNALPRVPSVESPTQEVYLQAVRDILSANGLPNSEPKITQLLRIDLEGDGESEVLVTATSYADPGIPGVTAGDYSLAFLRKVINGQVQTFILGADYYTENIEFAAPVTYTVPAVLDVNGDGKMEIITYSSYYEGHWTTVVEVTGDKLEEVLSCGCGS